jgi:hypothetical protein
MDCLLYTCYMFDEGRRHARLGKSTDHTPINSPQAYPLTHGKELTLSDKLCLKFPFFHFIHT